MAILPAGAKGEFTCPDCGSHEWGTSLEGVARGECHGTLEGQACRFTWFRSNDSKFFIVRGWEPTTNVTAKILQPRKGNPT